MRIASLLPAATEIVCALDLDGALIGVSHECDYPPGVAGLPRLTRSAIPPGLRSSEIDHEVRTRFERGEPLYEVDEALLLDLRPDLVLTQAVCQVCAVSYDDVCRLASRLPNQPDVLPLQADSLDGMFDDIRRVAQGAGCTARGEARVAGLRARLDRLTRETRRRAWRGTGSPLRVVALEWLDPPYVAGHWVPEMIALAGGHDALGRLGERSRRVTWGEVVDAQPDVILLMPCGYSQAAAEQAFEQLPRPAGWDTIPAVRTGRIYAVDANSYFSRPAPRLIEGVEQLHGLLRRHDPSDTRP